MRRRGVGFMRAGRVLSAVVFLAIIPTLVLVGVFLMRDRQYAMISILAALLSCVPFFSAYERRNSKTTEMVLVAAMTALSVVGRVVFAPTPGFKPVTAITVITAMHFGPQAGFMTGSLSALVSNIFFGQGPWTPFQMLVWGVTGYVAGLLCEKKILRGRWSLIAYGILAGIGFSLVMDIWTVLAFDGQWNWSRYFAAAAAALPFTFTYAASNVTFLLVLNGPIGKRLERVKKKYGLGHESEKRHPCSMEPTCRDASERDWLP